MTACSIGECCPRRGRSSQAWNAWEMRPQRTCLVGYGMIGRSGLRLSSSWIEFVAADHIRRGGDGIMFGHFQAFHAWLPSFRPSGTTLCSRYQRKNVRLCVLGDLLFNPLLLTFAPRPHCYAKRCGLGLCVRFFLFGCSFINVAAWRETRLALCSSRSLGDRGHKNPMGTANPGPPIQSQDY